MGVIPATTLLTLNSYLPIVISINIFRSKLNMLFNLKFSCTCHKIKNKAKNTKVKLF